MNTSGGGALAPDVEAFLSRTSIFCQPWWLEAVSPGQWGVAVARRGEEVAGAWPYTFTMKLGRYRLLETPKLFFFLGPWLRPSTAKSARRLETEKDILTELEAALPPFAAFHQWFHPGVTNWLPLYWKGFTQTTRYTYRVAEPGDKDALWGGLKENIRTDIKKAGKQVRVIEEANAERLLTVLRATYARQGAQMPFPESTFLRLDAECAARGVRRIVSAVDEQDRVHASAYLVSDASSVYSLMRAADPELRNSGASSLVMWEALQHAAQEHKAFDFVGSHVEPIERFVRAFGGLQVPFFEISKMNSVVVSTYRASWILAHRAAQALNFKKSWRRPSV